MIAADDISGLVLAGGQGRRMQATSQPHDARAVTMPVEKGLMLLHGDPLVSWAVRAMPADLAAIYISANRHHDSYARYGVVMPDDPALGADLGPLAGVASVMQRMSTPWLYVVPADVPSPPPGLLERLVRQVSAQGIDLAYACTDQPQPLFMLVNKRLLSSLQLYLREGSRQVQRWQREHGEAVQFDGASHQFFNINTPDDLHQAHQLIGQK